MIVFVTVVVTNMAAMVVFMMMEMPELVVMLVGSVMQPFTGPRPTGVLAEHKRLDGDRHSV